MINGVRVRYFTVEPSPTRWKAKFGRMDVTIGAKLRLKKWALDEVGAAVFRQKLAEALREHGFYDVVEHGISVFKNIRLHDEDSEPY
jgi:hypothetical protein